jgi:hypothetical protein
MTCEKVSCAVCFVYLVGQIAALAVELSLLPSFARQQTFSRCRDYSTILCIILEHVDLADEIFNLADRTKQAHQLLAEENCHISILAQELLKSGNYPAFFEARTNLRMVSRETPKSAATLR